MTMVFRRVSIGAACGGCAACVGGAGGGRGAACGSCEDLGGGAAFRGLAVCRKSLAYIQPQRIIIHTASTRKCVARSCISITIVESRVGGIRSGLKEECQVCTITFHGYR